MSQPPVWYEHIHTCKSLYFWVIFHHSGTGITMEKFASRTGIGMDRKG